MRILVCIKRVPDVGSAVTLTDDAHAVDARHVGYTVAAHEQCAVEIATRLADGADGQSGSVTLLTVGPDEAVEQLRHLLGVGAHAATLVQVDPKALGPADIAKEIAAVVAAHEAEHGAYDLVLLGNDAADSGDFQVGVRLAYALGWPVVNGAAHVETSADLAGRVRTTHESPHGTETYELPLPAVVTVLEGGVEPRYPTLKGRMAAKKIAIESRTPAHEPQGSGRLRMHVPPPAPSTVEVLGEGPEAAPAVVDLLEKLGVLR